MHRENEDYATPEIIKEFMETQSSKIQKHLMDFQSNLQNNNIPLSQATHAHIQQFSNENIHNAGHQVGAINLLKKFLRYAAPFGASIPTAEAQEEIEQIKNFMRSPEANKQADRLLVYAIALGSW